MLCDFNISRWHQPTFSHYKGFTRLLRLMIKEKNGKILPLFLKSMQQHLVLYTYRVSQKMHLCWEAVAKQRCIFCGTLCIGSCKTLVIVWTWRVCPDWWSPVSCNWPLSFNSDILSLENIWEYVVLFRAVKSEKKKIYVFQRTFPRTYCDTTTQTENVWLKMQFLLTRYYYIL